MSQALTVPGPSGSRTPGTVTVRLPAVLRPMAGGSAEIHCIAITLGDLLERLAIVHPALGRVLADADGQISPFVNLYLNGREVWGNSSRMAELEDGDEIIVITAIAGG